MSTAPVDLAVLKPASAAADRCSVLLVFPRFNPNSFWALKDTCAIAGAKAPSPPLGLLTVAAMLPQHWTFRLIDLNGEALGDDDIRSADMVMTGGMLPQADSAVEVIERCRAAGVPVVVGGPDPTSRPEIYAEADFRVLGEVEPIIGDFVEAWRRGERKGHFEAPRFKTDVTTTPIPRWDLIDLEDYLYIGVQFSRGCPFNCEFCDIIELYGRVPRAKTNAQILAELDHLYALGKRGHVDFVDDNLIGNKKALKKFLPELTAWQAARGYPFMFSTEASLNLADDDELLAMLATANFFIVFIGIESGDTDTLVSMQKKQNTRRSIAQSVNKIYGAGIHAIAGFIIGFDTERASVARDMIETIEATNIPIGIVGLLTSLPNTQLQRRLEREDRIIEGWAQSPDGSGDQCTAGLNFKTLRPRRDILVDYKTVLESVYSPAAFFGRLERMTAQLVRPRLKVKLERRHWARNLRIFGRLCAEITLRRREMAPLFWRYLARTLWRNPRSIEFVVMNIIMYLHVGRFTRFVISDMERRIGEIDAGLDPTRPRLSDADVARTAEKQVAA
jgi:radical SAM superfamily enzyme YgiQ (UPF0313 family)